MTILQSFIDRAASLQASFAEGRLVSATAQKRIDFALPKMKKNQDLMLWIVFNAIGLESVAQLNASYNQWRLRGKKATREEVLDAVKDRLNQKSIVDPYIPWLAAQLSKDESTRQQLTLVGENLVRGFRSIAVWASETKQDISKVSLVGALLASDSYVPNAARKGTQESDANPVVYRFADGHKVVELKTDEALKREGEVMKHCVGDYCEAVSAGESIIYSLRDPSGKSLITMELDPESGHFVQIFGPSNRDPNDEEKKLVREFIEQKFPNDRASLLVLGRPLTPEEMEGLDIENESYAVKKAFAGNPNTPEKILEVLSVDSFENGYNINELVAKNPGTSPSILDRMSYHKDTGIREAVASNPNTAPDTLDRLSRDASERVADAVAENESTPAATLARLAADGDFGQRARVAINPSAPESVMKTLLGDGNVSVRYHLAGNEAAPRSILEELLDDSDTSVRERAARTLEKHKTHPAVEAASKLLAEAKTIMAGGVVKPDTPRSTILKIALPKGLSSRFPPPEKNSGFEPHLTLIYVTSGEMTPGQREELVAMVRKVCRRIPPFRLALDVTSGLQDFGDSESGEKALWFGVREDPAGTLGALHYLFKQALTLSGMPCEHRNEFHPHVTWQYVPNDQSEKDRARMSNLASNRFNDLNSTWFDVRSIVVSCSDGKDYPVALTPSHRVRPTEPDLY